MQWPKPAEGSWTEHYPALGTGRVVFDVTPEFYELERDAIFKRAWLNVGRVEQIPKLGSYFTKELPMAKTSIVVVRGTDGEVRAFHNICRHRGNKLVWQDFPREEVSGTCRQFTCKYHGWRYSLAGDCTFVQQEDEFFDLDKADYGLVPVHCDVWAGFIFVNLDDTPRWSLPEFLGPMVTALDGYPFDRMTERYEFRAEVDANWKIFLDAFQEYYHVPALHPQQVPAAVRNPDAAFECAHFQLDGPHRVTSSGGARRWTLAPEAMYPIEVALRSGLIGPWEVPDIGDAPGVNPGRVDPWGIDNFQIFPNLEILIYRGWYLAYRYWPTSHNTHLFEGMLYFQPATTVRERVEHEVAAVVFKEFALQDAGTLKGTQQALDSGLLREFPLGDQELLVRHFHETVADWVEGAMTDARLPAAFADLEPFAATWCLATESERYDRRMASSMEDMQSFYDAFFPRVNEAVDYCDKFPLDDLPDDARRLLQLVHSLVMVSMAVEIWHQPRPVDSADAYLDRVVEPLP